MSRVGSFTAVLSLPEATIPKLSCRSKLVDGSAETRGNTHATMRHTEKADEFLCSTPQQGTIMELEQAPH